MDGLPALCSLLVAVRVVPGRVQDRDAHATVRVHCEAQDIVSSMLEAVVQVSANRLQPSQLAARRSRASAMLFNENEYMNRQCVKHRAYRTTVSVVALHVNPLCTMLTLHTRSRCAHHLDATSLT